MSLAECLSKVSYKEYLIWHAYFQQEMQEPSKSDWYLMKIAQEIRSQTHSLCNSKKPVEALETFKVPFTFSKKQKRNKPPLSKKEVSNILKARWMTIVGGASHGK